MCAYRQDGTNLSNPVTPAQGGTGVANNASSTLTISGAFATTLTITGITGVTLPTSGTLATTAQIPSTPISLANGGTAANLSASNGGIVYSGASAFAVLGGTATAGQILRSGASTTPGWSTATYPATAGTSGNILTSDGTNWSSSAPATSGTVTSVSGTTNQVSVATGTTTPVISLVGPYTPATYTAHGVLVGAGTSSIAALAAGTSGQVLQSGGASANPAYSTATYPAVATGTGKILRADGTNWVATTATFPDTAGTSGNVLTSDGTNWSSTAPVAGKSFVAQFNACSNASPADSVTSYLTFATIAQIGALTTSTPQTRFYIPIACTLKAVYGSNFVTGTLGTTENSTLSVRVNDTTNTTITSTLQFAAAATTFNNSGLSISLNAGDFINIIITTPVWGTNPTNVQIVASVLFQ